VRADVLEWLPEAAARGSRFERVFCSYGVAGWLSDLDLWARGIHGVLAPGGHFAYVELHPLLWSFDEQFRATKDPYFAPGHVFVEPVADYVGQSGALLAPSGFIGSTEPLMNQHPAHSFQWTLADIVTAVASSGLVVERLEEYPFLNGVRSIASLIEREGRRLYPPDGIAALPLMFGLRARRD
jgi:hypothetical protein